MSAHAIWVGYDGRTWTVRLARTDLALPAPAPTDLPADIRQALADWLRGDRDSCTCRPGPLEAGTPHNADCPARPKDQP